MVLLWAIEHVRMRQEVLSMANVLRRFMGAALIASPLVVIASCIVNRA